MKTAFLILATALTALGQAPELTEVARGPHSRTWQTVRQVESEKGVIQVTNRIEELQSGLHRWTGQEWIVTDPKVELFQDGAVARNLQFSLIFGPNLASQGATDILLPSGERLTGQILGLAYVEGDRSALIAEIKDCVGEVGGADHTEVTYRDAFTDFSIDVRYLVRRASFSQEILIKQRLPSPEEYGLSEKAVLMLLNEWTTFPQITKQTRVWQEGNANQEAITDEQISLGPMEFSTGKAFTVGGDRSFSVAKSFEQLEQRWFLLEKLPWKKIQPELAKLPVGEARNRNGKPEALKQAKKGLPLPARREAKKTIKPIQMAKTQKPSEPGFLWDYELMTTSSNFRFKRDATYYVAGEVILSGETRLEAAVIKFAPTNSARLNITGTVVSESSDYAPIILTARDDHTVGESIGSVSLNGFATNSTGLKLGIAADGNTLKHLRFSYLDKALEFDTGEPAQLNVAHVQFVKCKTCLNALGGDFGNTITVDNGLFYSIDTLLDDDPEALETKLYAQHITVNQCNTLNAAHDGYSYLTNSLLVAVTNLGASASLTTNSTVYFSSNPGGIFQTVGAGSHYLASSGLGNSFRNAGTTNISQTLREDLRKRSTYPPIVLSNTITMDTTLSPQAQRDTDLPDLGYHYDPIDFAVNTVVVTNATVLLTNGVAIATFGSHGFWVQDYAQLISEGSPLRPNILARYYAIQEQSTNWGNGAVASTITINPYNNGNSPPTIRLRFTHSIIPSSGGYHIYAYAGTSPDWRLSKLEIKDSYLAGGWLPLSDTTNAVHGLTNNLFERLYWYIEGGAALTAYNNLLRDIPDGWLYQTELGNTWNFSDNLVDNSIVYNIAEFLVHENNAFYQSSDFYSIYPTNASEIILTNLTYQSGALGNLYQPTNSVLINSGSRYATNAGLAHFTLTTNQIKDSGWVDIGWHVVALTNGVPFDADGDSLADYLEDRNGNSAFDSSAGETDWNSYNSLYGLTGSPGLQVFTPLK